ncbi:MULTISPECIES: ATP-binding protein [Streptomyces]|uniref:ATP-binding protein n=1 Tax=Streptomyces TaxID=1883 RepID=UPI0016704FB0|nr:AAA family ATPase [Streptomyces ruber]
MPLTTFVGRQREVAEICARLERTRLVTLTGAGGVGKSRLTLEVATRTAAHRRDGVRFVELAGLTEPQLVANAVAAVLDVPEHPERALPDILAEQLREADLLLFLDGCEHLLKPMAQLVHMWLTASRGLRILTTSRERLGIRGEILWPVTGLAAPPEHVEGIEVEGFEAVRAFLERAAAVDPGFRLTASTATAVGARTGPPSAAGTAERQYGWSSPPR